MKYRCDYCDKIFKKFVLFEGHFDFNAKCREKHSCFLQCYVCLQEFRHSAALKYHLQQHTTRYVNKVAKKTQVSPPQVPKITLRKQWNFKIVPQVQENEETKNPQRESLACKICRKKFRSNFYLEQHTMMHRKKRLIRSRVPYVPTQSTTTVVQRHTKKSRPCSRRACSVCNILVYGGKDLGNIRLVFN